ncbi:MAG: dihydropteroate synthase [Dehalococcoidia bacterium]|jgi:5-methyltetrahydrofolate--homocysteine methyltransferase|nr:dihydropteroate synthase [Dehalococcoidia bacterium]
MSRVIHNADQFIVIGENIHATRVVKRGGVRGHVYEDGTEAVKYKVGGDQRFVAVPEHFIGTQPYEQGNLKHFMIAMWQGLNGTSDESDQGKNYIRYEVERQINAGSHYLDLNVDESSYRLLEQKQTMEWVVKFVESVSAVPPSVDSSNAEIIEVGLTAYGGSQGRPMLNSIALERPEAIDMALKYDARAIVMASNEVGMPSDSDERVENVGRILEMALTKGMAKEDIFVDPLFFPIAVDSNYGRHALDAISRIRADFGDQIHIAGGMSNVSFGIPKRRLVNDVFLYLAIEAGADSGIVDPMTTSAARSLNIDLESKPVELAMELLQGDDDFAMKYITAFRDGDLD